MAIVLRQFLYPSAGLVFMAALWLLSSANFYIQALDVFMAALWLLSSINFLSEHWMYFVGGCYFWYVEVVGDTLSGELWRWWLVLGAALNKFCSYFQLLMACLDVKYLRHVYIWYKNRTSNILIRIFILMSHFFILIRRPRSSRYLC